MPTRSTTIFDARPDVLNHNLETVARLQRAARPSAALLPLARAARPGEGRGSRHQVGDHPRHGRDRGRRYEGAIADLRNVGVDILTLGQYLRPSEQHLPVVRWWTPDEFAAPRRVRPRPRLRPRRVGPARALELPRPLGARCDAGPCGRRVLLLAFVGSGRPRRRRLRRPSPQEPEHARATRERAASASLFRARKLALDRALVASPARILSVMFAERMARVRAADGPLGRRRAPALGRRRSAVAHRLRGHAARAAHDARAARRRATPRSSSRASRRRGSSAQADCSRSCPGTRPTTRSRSWPRLVRTRRERRAIGDQTWARFVLDLQAALPGAALPEGERGHRAAPGREGRRRDRRAAERGPGRRRHRRRDARAALRRAHRGSRCTASSSSACSTPGTSGPTSPSWRRGPTARARTTNPASRVIAPGDVVLCDFGGTMRRLLLRHHADVRRRRPGTRGARDLRRARGGAGTSRAGRRGRGGVRGRRRRRA